MPDSHKDICGDATLAVLIGGQSSRMGFSKSDLKIDYIPILEFLYRRLLWPGPTVLVDAPGREKPPGHELFGKVIADPVIGEGPLRGVLTAMEHTTSPLLVVIPLDMPCMTIEVLWLLVNKLREQSAKTMAMFQREGELQPLPAAFVVAKARPIVRERLSSRNASLHGLTSVLNNALVLPDPSWTKTLWVNLNRPADVEDLLAKQSYRSVP